VRINEGKIIGKFADRVTKLLSSTEKAFYENTAASSIVRERASRALQLSNSVRNAAAVLFKQQLLVLQNNAVSSFKSSLVRLARTHTETSPEEEQQSLRQAAFDFQVIASELESEFLGLNSSDAQMELAASLKTALEDFSESPAAKLEAVRKFDYQSKRSQRKKQQGINIGLNLVGMLRPPGNGGLQGFVGYSTGLFGMPLELLLGVHNDGDSPEIVGDDREYPILRLQPKMHFDVNL